MVFEGLTISNERIFEYYIDMVSINKSSFASSSVHCQLADLISREEVQFNLHRLDYRIFRVHHLHDQILCNLFCFRKAVVTSESLISLFLAYKRIKDQLRRSTEIITLCFLVMYSMGMAHMHKRFKCWSCVLLQSGRIVCRRVI